MNNRRISVRAALCLPFVLVAGGCINHSHDVALYRKILNGDRLFIVPTYNPADALPLRQAMTLADADNEAIASKGEDYIQALADKMRDAGTFLPTVGVAPTYNLAHGGSSSSLIGSVASGSAAGGTIAGGGAPSAGQGRVSHQISVPLDASFTGSLANISTLRAAGFTSQQKAQLLLDERETILLQVVQNYYNAIKSERQTAVYEDGVRLKTEKVRDQEARLKLGNVRPLDLATSQSDLAATRASLIQSRTDAANYRSALARLMGVATVDGPLVDAFDPPLDVPPLDKWQDLASRTRQDLLAAVRAAEAARQKIDAAIREYFPSVTINFNYFIYNDPRSSQLWSGVLSANLPIFSALSIEADIRSAWSQYRQACLNQSQTRRQVVDDVNESYRNLTNSRNKIEQLEIEVTAARKASDLAERAYRLGSESNLDRLTQQDNLLTAQLNLVSEQFSAKSSYLGLLRASGSLATILQ